MEKYIVEVHSDRTVWKNEKGEVHRLNGPAIEYADGHKSWFLNDKLHREDGPAVEWANGTFWYLNGKQHREDGPAVEWANRYKAWYLNDNLHREDGPAIENADGDKTWFLNGKKLSEADFNNRNKKDPCEGKVIEIAAEKLASRA